MPGSAAAILLSLLCWMVFQDLEQGSALGQEPCCAEAETLLLLFALHVTAATWCRCAWAPTPQARPP